MILFFIELDMTVKEVTLNDDSGLESTISEEKSFEGQIVEKIYTFEETCFQDIWGGGGTWPTDGYTCMYSTVYNSRVLLSLKCQYFTRFR